MRFALFFLGEYAGMITTSCVCVALFFGGWHFPGLGGGLDPNNRAVTGSLIICILRAIVFFAKMIVIIFVFMWVRWSLPRFRFDQLMDIAWRALIPISLALTVLTAVLVWATGGATLDGVRARYGLAFFVMNVGVVLVTMVVANLLPAPPPTNRRVRVFGSRFNRLIAAAGA
jgi:NADH-quinone oxidoreductase subunit H